MTAEHSSTEDEYLERVADTWLDNERRSGRVDRRQAIVSVRWG